MTVPESLEAEFCPTKTGWIDLYTAQLLWVSHMSNRHRIRLKAFIPDANVPAVQIEGRATLPKALVREIDRLVHRAGLAACHVCDVCGVATSEVTVLPARCTAHKKSPQLLDEIDTIELARKPDPLAEIVTLSEKYLDGLFLGGSACVASLLESSGALYAAARVRHECLFESSQFALHVAHPLLIAERSHTILPRYTSGQIAKALEANYADQQLLGSQSLRAAAQTWARYGHLNAHLQGLATHGLAKAAALAARRASDGVLAEVPR